jgi:hypothetical protein
MAYIVGWRDLPAARLLVPVMEILDYVSPYALEEWEYNMELELEEDRAKLEEEKRELAQHPEKATLKEKARPPVHSEIEAAAVAEAESDAHAKGRPKKGAMSLSTPQKTKLDAFDDLFDNNFDGDESPSEQIAREIARTHHGPAPGRESRETSTSESETQMKAEDDAEIPLFNKEWPGPILTNATLSKPPTASDGDVSSSKLHPFFQFRQSEPTSSSNAPKADSAPASDKNRVKKGKQKLEMIEVADPNDGWEVERIEDSELYEVEGRGLVRYYKVRWVGDWPPEENPTWEPEENIPAKMVRKYLKAARKKRKASETEPANDNISTTKKPKGLVQSTLSWPMAGTYSSVDEAGVGQVEDDGSTGEDDGTGANAAPDEDEQNGDAADDCELRIVQNEPQPSQSNWSNEDGYGTRMAFQNYT